MITEKNSFSDNVDTFMFFSLYSVISGNTNTDIDAAIAAMGLESYRIPELLLLIDTSHYHEFCPTNYGHCDMVILYSRMLEIFLMCSIAPIPLTTIANKEWGYR